MIPRWLLLAFLLSSVPLRAAAQTEPHEEYMRAHILEILSETSEEFAGIDRTVQIVRMEIISGPDDGEIFELENGILQDRADMRLRQGETIVMRKLVKSDGTSEYLIAEKYRLPSLFWLSAFFLLLVFLFSGWTGLRSITGLLLSIGILALFVVPKIAAGANPLLISLAGSFAIACTSLYLAHGFHRRTTVALASTLLTLAISVLLAVVFVHFAKLFGMGTEESMFLQMGQLQVINLRGLLLGGIIIGCLGVLDDVTTAQTAAIDEIRKANPTLSNQQLLRAGFSVGKEHIASLINTLALAYAGASLPLLLIFSLPDDYPLWVLLNSEFISEEIIRTLVGSATLLFAVPISTVLAVTFLHGEETNGHGHTHRH
ncbi:MAG TPA: YibE/F family protein [Candidatus Peribacteraceae bacterium]|nr:YibE/F family protein [Candidatus Peribacteraceae bacterium]